MHRSVWQLFLDRLRFRRARLLEKRGIEPPQPGVGQPTGPAQAESDEAEQLADTEQQVADEVQATLADEESDNDATSDAFFCTDCASLWLLSTRPNPMPNPHANPCSTCGGDTLLGLMQARAMTVRSGDTARVAHPSRPPAGAAKSQRLADARTKGTDVGAYFLTQLVLKGPEPALAKTTAREVSTFARQAAEWLAPADHCAGLSAIADGLDWIPKGFGRGIAWIATEIFGLPDLFARAIGGLATQMILPVHSLHAMAQGIRVVGALSCAADGCLGHCQCARNLGKEMVNSVITTKIDDSFTPVTVIRPTTVMSDSTNHDVDLQTLVIEGFESYGEAMDEILKISTSDPPQPNDDINGNLNFSEPGIDLRQPWGGSI